MSFVFGLQHNNTFIENFGCAVAIETIQKLRCVWETAHIYIYGHTCMHAKVVFQNSF